MCMRGSFCVFVFLVLVLTCVRCLCWRCLAFFEGNPSRHNLLAVGLDRAQREPSLLIWDVSSRLVSHSLGAKKSTSVHGQESYFRHGGRPQPMAQPHGTARTAGPTELALGDGVLSLAWVPDKPDILLAGIGSKWLRLFDVRGGARTTHTVSTARGAYKLAVDPHSSNLFASFSRTDHAIKIWDLRQVNEPVFSLPTDPRKMVSKLSWCPTRQGLLGALFNDSSAVTMYDTRLRKTAEFDQDAGRLITQRSIPASSTPTLCDFSWHPHDRNRIVTVTTQGAVNDFDVDEPTSISLSTNGDLIYSRANALISIKDCECALAESVKAVRATAAGGGGSEAAVEIPAEDISTKMRRRVLSGYGMEIETNLTLCTDTQGDESLCDVWRFVQRQTEQPHGAGIVGVRAALTLDVKVATRIVGTRSPPRQHSGARGTIGSSGGGGGAFSFSNSGPAAGIQTYDTSTQRKLALMLCGWTGMDDETALNTFLQRLEEDGEYERSAAVAIFHQDIRRGIEALSKGAAAAAAAGADSGGFLSAAMALSGYSPRARAMAGRPVTLGAPTSDDTLWKETCAAIRTRLPSAYLRAALGFLTSYDEDYDEV